MPQNKKTKLKFGAKEYLVEEGLPEFNQMAYYNIRMDRRSDERDLALNNGEVDTFYRTTLTLLMNCIPRFQSKGMDDEKITKLKTDLLNIGKKIQGLINLPEKARELNSMKYEELLFQYNIGLNIQMFTYGMIFPSKEIKTLKEKIAEDFGKGG